jgi:ribosomal small subunit protein bTHX
MGKGDKKSKKGKRWKGSFGVARNRSAIKSRLKRSAGRKSASVAAEAAQAKPKKTTTRKKSEA